jgi:hypothetical protein
MQILGQATYHILCTQMIYFSILFAVLKNHYYQNELVQWVLGSSFSESEYYISMTIYLLIAWCINIPLGIIWYLIEQRIIKKISKRKTLIVMDSHGDK